MKRLLLLFFTLLVNFPICTAAPSKLAIASSLSSKIQTNSQSNDTAAPKTSRMQQIRLALQPVLEKNQLKNNTPISFDAFLRKADQLQQKRQQAAHIQAQAQAAFSNAFFFKGQPRMLFQGTPNYAKEFQGKKYIFIGEASDHDQASLVRHTISILKLLRKNNPQAKILLANEFSIVGDTNTWPIRFANVKNKRITTLGGYNVLEQAADQLDIDVLALDDACLQEDEASGKAFAKIGPSWVSINPKDKRVRNITSDFGMDPTDPQMAAVSSMYFLESNPYGVELRNRQWVSYIKAVQSFYDIIVVYAGNAHLDTSGSGDSVPLMLNPAQAVTVYLYSTEELPSEAKEAYALREKIQDKFKQKSNDSQAVETFDDSLGNEDLSNAVDLTIDFSKPNYRRYDGKAVTQWREQHIRNVEAFNNFKQQHLAFEKLMGRSPLHFPQWLSFDVYLE